MSHRNQLIAGLVLATAGTLALGSGTPTLAAVKKATTTVKPAAAAVTIKNFAFNPSKVTGKAGKPIMIMNADGFPHTFTADDGKTFNTNAIKGGTSVSVTIAKAGTYMFHCNIHHSMMGTITIT